MKRIYNILLVALGLVALLTFLPWIYSIAFPGESSDPFVAWSPVSDSFVVSEVGDDASIFTVDSQGKPVDQNLSKEQRDSLVPQMYFNQLTAHNALPDTIAGLAVDVPTLKHAQWVFNSLPRDINRVDPGVYPIMESRPKRVDLEDPTEVFTLGKDGIHFYDMATNTENTARSRHFAQVLDNRRFAYPLVAANADVTARKAYDEGYLLIDSDGRLFHMKMQAGQPYLAAIAMPEGVRPVQAFILENPDRQLIGLVATADSSLYAIEREGYTPVKLPIEDVCPAAQRVMIMKNLFNWVIKTTDEHGSRWTAIKSDDYSLLGRYSVETRPSTAERVAHWIFPCRITFTDINDCYARPRITDFSWPATAIWLIIIAIISIIIKHKNK